MKRITIEEFINMPVNELNKLIDENSHPNETDRDTGGIEVDMEGLQINDLVKKYDLLTVDQAIDNVIQKLNHKR